MFLRQVRRLLTLMIHIIGCNLKKYQRVYVFLIPLVLLLCLYLIAQSGIIDDIHLWDCVLYKYTHIYCPGCGMTRAVKALFHGDILLSLRQNALLISSIIVLLLLYIEFVFKVFNKNIFLIWHNKLFWIIFLVFSLLYSILRNFDVFLPPRMI